MLMAHYWISVLLTMVYKRKTWCEKLRKDIKPHIEDDPRGRGKMLVPSPLLVDSMIRQIPKGRLSTVKILRDKLAKDFGADLTCPLATGWFLRIAAECAEEMLRKGEKTLDEVTPYWRVLKADGSLNEKFPGGVELQAKRLRNEGFKIVKKGRKYKVENYEKYLWYW